MDPAHKHILRRLTWISASHALHLYLAPLRAPIAGRPRGGTETVPAGTIAFARLVISQAIKLYLNPLVGVARWSLPLLWQSLEFLSLPRIRKNVVARVQSQRASVWALALAFCAVSTVSLIVTQMLIERSDDTPPSHTDRTRALLADLSQRVEKEPIFEWVQFEIQLDFAQGHAETGTMHIRFDSLLRNDSAKTMRWRPIMSTLGDLQEFRASVARPGEAARTMRFDTVAEDGIAVAFRSVEEYMLGPGDTLLFRGSGKLTIPRRGQKMIGLSHPVVQSTRWVLRVQDGMNGRRFRVAGTGVAVSPLRRRDEVGSFVEWEVRGPLLEPLLVLRWAPGG